MPTRDTAPLERLLRRLSGRAQIPNLVLGVLLLVLFAGLIFLGFALFIRIRTNQLIEALRADPPRVESIRLQTRRGAPMGITVMTSVFAVITFRSASGGKRMLHLRGKAADLAELTREIQAACPTVRVDDPQTVTVIVV